MFIKGAIIFIREAVIFINKRSLAVKKGLFKIAKAKVVNNIKGVNGRNLR